MKEGNIVDKFKDKLIYSDNLHNYDYDKLVNNYIMKDEGRKAKDKYDVSDNKDYNANTLKDSYNSFRK